MSDELLRKAVELVRFFEIADVARPFDHGVVGAGDQPGEVAREGGWGDLVLGAAEDERGHASAPIT